MKDYATIFKAFVGPYLACAFGSAVAFNFATGQDIPQLLWAIFVAALAEVGIEVGWLKLKKK